MKGRREGEVVDEWQWNLGRERKSRCISSTGADNPHKGGTAEFMIPNCQLNQWTDSLPRERESKEHVCR